MFTGIITHIGRVKRIEKKGDWRFTIAAPGFASDAAIGASVAVSGVCLTIIQKAKDSFTVQVSKETLKNTTLGTWKKGTAVNLEHALKVGDELGGHFVSGHVDVVATLTKIKTAGESKEMWFSCHSRAGGDDNFLMRFIAKKGSVTLDGVSLTVNQVAAKNFSVNIIPHTLGATTLGERKAGDSVNLEIDLLMRHCARLLSGTKRLPIAE